MKERSIVSSVVSGAVALLIVGGHAKQQKWLEGQFLFHSGSFS
jgi:hypothetical protein